MNDPWLPGTMATHPRRLRRPGPTGEGWDDRRPSPTSDSGPPDAGHGKAGWGWAGGNLDDGGIGSSGRRQPGPCGADPVASAVELLAGRRAGDLAPGPCGLRV